MRRVTCPKILLLAILCLIFSCNNVFALDATTDLIDHTSGINPATKGNITDITTTHNIDTYHWSSFNLKGNETANFIFNANGQTALNYLSPGANPSAIYGSIISSGASGNILLFNPNGIMMGAGASISGANTFFASTNKFDGIVNGKVTFSETEKNNPLTIGNIKFNNVNNAHFVAPNVIVNADNINTANSISFRAIGGGEYDVNINLFSKEIGVKNTASEVNLLDVNTKATSNKITIQAKADSNAYATALVSGEIQANRAITGENGEIYIIASNNNTSSTAGIQVLQNAAIIGDSAKVDIDTKNFVQNANIDVSGDRGGNIEINTESFDQNANISARGSNGDGGSVRIRAISYVGIGDSNIDVSGTAKGGNIDLQSDYQILSSGNYNASSSKGVGGEIKISAPLTKLYGVDVDASGYSAGGNIYIGGAGTSLIDITNSYTTMINDGSAINANSSNGKGGNIYIDSLGATYAFGTIDASGNGLGGGYVELSGDESLSIGEKINAGSGGTIYLDPKNIIITDSEIGQICYNILFTDSIPINVALDLSQHSNFGSSIAIYNNLLAVGAQGSGSAYKGAAYLFYFTENTEFSNLTLFKTLHDGVKIGSSYLTLADNANFGSAIALTNKLLAVGAQGAGSGDGAVYLLDFTANSNYTALKLDSVLTYSGSHKSFGSSLALSQCTSDCGTYNLLAVGAQGSLESVAGKELLYKSIYNSSSDPYSELSLVGTFTGTDSASGDNFGSGSALSTFTSGGITYGLLAVGADGELPVAGGAVYLYQIDLSNPGTLTLKKTIDKTNFSQIQDGDAFGSSVALLPVKISSSYYDLLAVGAENSDLVSAPESGGVYYLSINSSYNLEYNGGIHSGTSETHMGSAVAFGQTPVSTPKYNLLAVGLDGSSKGYTDAGEMYLYTFTPNTKYDTLSFAGQYFEGSTVKGAQSLSTYDLFGWSVALYKNLLAIGAPGDDTGADYAGAAYLYSFNSGTLYKNLTLNKKMTYGSNVLDTSGHVYTFNLKADDLFGFSVALYDGLLAIGAAGVDSSDTKTNTGALYLFSFNSGTTYSSLTIDEVLEDGSVLTNGELSLAKGDYFGGSAAIYNNLLAVGAQYTDEGTVSDAGAVYLFTFDSDETTNPFEDITLMKELQSIPDSYTLETSDCFGWAVSLYNNQLAVGAIQTKIDDIITGAAYLFDVSSPDVPDYETKISSIPDYTLNNFGSGVSLYGNLLAIGDRAYGSYKGAVFLFHIEDNDYSSPIFDTSLVDGSELINNSGGTYTLSLSYPNQFGNSVSIYDYLLTVGSPGYSEGTGGANAGAVYLLNMKGAILGDYKFETYPSETLYLSPAVFANWLSSGNVTLQANNNIEFWDSISVSGGAGETLTLQAGNSIVINSNLAINLGNANLVATANENKTDTTLDDNYRDPDVAALFSMESGSSITTGSGNVTITMNTGSGKSPSRAISGDITLRSISASNINLYNKGLTTGSDIIIYGPLTATSLVGTSNITSTGYIEFLNSTASNFSGALNMTSVGDITQILTGGGISATGTANFTSSGGSIYLSNDSNDFKDTVLVSADNANIHDKNGLEMGAVTTDGDLKLLKGAGGESGDLIIDEATVGGNLSLSAYNGNITQNATTGHEITLTNPTGTTSLNATKGIEDTGSVDLSNANNDFTGTVSVSAEGDAKIYDQNELLMGESNIANDLTLSTIGNITQNAKIEVGNNTHLNTLTDITFDNSENDFCYDAEKSGTININENADVVASYANSAIINDADSVHLGNINIAEGLTLTAGKHVTQSEGTTLNLYGGTSTITANGYVTLYNVVVGTPSSLASLTVETKQVVKSPAIKAAALAGIEATTISDYNVILTTAEVNGTLTVDAINNIEVTETITGIADGAFSFTAGNDVNIGTSTQTTPVNVATGGADFTVTAGRSFNMIGNSATNPTIIDTDGGDMTITANNTSGYLDTAEIAMSGNSLIDAGSGNVVIKLLNTDDSNAGKMTLEDITADTITILNQSLTAETDIVLNGTLTATGIVANPLIISSAGGNFTNNYGSGALVTGTNQRWLVYSGSPSETTLGGLTPVNTYYSSNISTVDPTTVAAGDSVLYRTPAPEGGGSSAGGAIAGGTIGGAAAAGAAGGYYGLGLLPGLLLGLASPTQFDESMIDIICNNQKDYPLLVRNIKYVYQTDDVCKLDSDTIGSNIFIPDREINNGSYQLVKVKVPAKFENAPKGVTVIITQKSNPFGVSKNVPDMNFNVFNTLNDKQINSIYQTRRFLKPKYLSKRMVVPQAGGKTEASNGIIQKTISIRPTKTANNLSIAVNYLKNGQFPRKSSSLKLDKQAYSLVIQFIENE